MNLADKLRQNNQRQRPQSTFGTNWKTKQLIPNTMKLHYAELSSAILAFFMWL